MESEIRKPNHTKYMNGCVSENEMFPWNRENRVTGSVATEQLKPNHLKTRPFEIRPRSSDFECSDFRSQNQVFHAEICTLLCYDIFCCILGMGLPRTRSRSGDHLLQTRLISNLCTATYDDDNLRFTRLGFQGLLITLSSSIVYKFVCLFV